MKKRIKGTFVSNGGVIRAGLLCALAVAIMAAAASCKMRPVAQPTQENLREAVRAYLVESGFVEAEPNKFQRAGQDGSTVINTLEELPAHVIEVPDGRYPYQGIMVRHRTVRSADGKESEPQKFLVIMWWDRKQAKWRHFTGADIPELQYKEP
jgi:hypothetical protein